MSSIRGWRPGGDPFQVPPGSRSCVNPRVLRPLTQGPQGQPSPLRTPHGRPGVQGILPTSPGQALHGCPMVHQAMTTGFPILWGCCSVFSASPHPLVRNPATSLSPVPRSVTHFGLFLTSRAFQFSGGCRVPLAPRPSLSCPPFPIIPCLYPTGPPATVWRGPTGSSSIRGPFRAPSTGGSLPAPVPFPCATSRRHSWPIPRVQRLPILLGLLCGTSNTPSSVPSPFPIIPCLYPTGPPATLWRGPTGSSAVRGPFCVPSTGRSHPTPFCLGGVLPSGLVGVPSSWPLLPGVPVPFPHLVTCGCLFFPHATRGP